MLGTATKMALVVLGACLVLGGCGDDGSQGPAGPAGPPGTSGGANFTGNFPGSQVTEQFVSNDGQAFSNSDVKINRGINVYWNCSDGTAIVLYPDQHDRLFAHFYDGTDFTPAVQLRGPNQRTNNDEDDPVRTNGSGETDDTWDSIGLLRVLFLNTPSRQGDAIIAWTRQDQDPVDVAGVPDNEDPNVRLHATYFDRSAVGTPSAGSVEYGFETAGIAVDYDNQLDGTDNDDWVSTIGFVSDSLCGSHPFDVRAGFEGTSRTSVADDSIEFLPHDFHEGGGTAMRPATRSGEATTFVSLIWVKGQGVDATPAPTRVNFLTLDLTGSGNPLTSQSEANFTSGANLVPEAPGPALDAVDVGEELVVHNGYLIWSGQSGGLRRFFLTAFVDSAGAPMAPATIELSDAGVAEADGTPTAENTYGDDHGLTSLYTFFGGSGDTIFAARTDLSATLDREIEEISGGGGSGGPGGTQLSRDGAWILGVWSEGGGVVAHAIRTKPDGALADSLLAGGPLPMPNQVDPVEIGLGGRIWFQREVTGGRDDTSFCSVQSNLNRLNFAWHETVADKVALRYNGLLVDLGPTPPTGALVETIGNGLVAEGDNGYEPWETDNGMHPAVADLGTTDGAPMIYFVNNANNPTDDAATGAFDEIRLFGWAGVPGAVPADARIVGTDGPGTDQTINDNFGDNSEDVVDDYYEAGSNFIRVKTTPPSANSSTAHSGTALHVFWLEGRDANDNASNQYGDSLPALRTRRLDKSAFAGSPNITTAHVPALTQVPVGLDDGMMEAFIPPTVIEDRYYIGPMNTFATANASGNVGIYFQSPWHFWYQEFDGTAWYDKPELVDNWSSGGLFPGRDQRALVFPPCLKSTCDDMSGTLLFISRSGEGDDYGVRRWYVRIRD